MVIEITGSKLFYDLSYQRDPQKRSRFLRKCAKMFDADLFGVLDVCQRPDGRYAIVDGAGRFYMATELLNFPASHEYLCIVHDAADLATEARLFVELNTVWRRC
jgi:hypothetical protein